VGLPPSCAGFAMSIPRGFPGGLLHRSADRITWNFAGRAAWSQAKGLSELFLQPMPPYLCAYAPKPAYATRYWQDRELAPEPLDVLATIERRAKRYYGALSTTTGTARLADSRAVGALQPETPEALFDWVITSPPYYGMRTYIPDQWLRNWFVGGPDAVDYTNRDQVVHSSPRDFVADLRQVWRNAAGVCAVDSQSRVLTRLPDAGGNPAWRRHTRMEALSPPWWRMQRTVGVDPLRPRNAAVPSYRPLHRCGYAWAAGP
jgi:hypothetical protein